MADSITFLDDLIDIDELQADAQLYFSDNKNTCKHFDKNGFCGMPEKAYSMADVRMQIQLGKTENDLVTFSVDCIMSDGTQYSSEIDPDFTKQQIPFKDFMQLTLRDFTYKVIKPAIDELQKWDGGIAEEETCKSVVGSYSIEGIAGSNPQAMAELLVDTVTKSFSLFKSHKNSKAYNEERLKVIKNIASAIESNDSRALQFFKTYAIKSDKSKTRNKELVNFGQAYLVEFPQVTRDSVKTKQPSKTARLPKDADSANEIIDILKQVKNSTTYASNFVTILNALATDKDNNLSDTDKKLCKILVKYLQDKS